MNENLVNDIDMEYMVQIIITNQASNHSINNLLKNEMIKIDSFIYLFILHIFGRQPI
jgi:hypothetical protein